MPALHNTLRGQIEHPAQGIIADKAGLVPGDLPELAIESLDDIGRIYDLTNLRRIFVERSQNIPVVLPAFHAEGVLFPPLLRELKQVPLRFKSAATSLMSFQLTKRVEERI